MRGLFTWCSIVILLCVLEDSSSQISGHPFHSSKKCAGLYCGRIVKEDGTLGECGACPRGSRTDGTKCIKCEDSPKLYDWLYLGFMCILALALHWFFIDYFSETSRLFGRIPEPYMFYISAFVEFVLSAIVTLLIMEPTGSLSLTSCHIKRISDWYTMFYNPSPDFVNKIHCTQEAVYPLYTIVLIYYAICTVMMVVMRPLLCKKLCHNCNSKSVYAALYFLPILTVIQAVFGGLIYYSYPYLILVGTIVSNAIVMARNDITSFRKLCESRRLMLILLAHWLMLAYGLLAVTELKIPVVHGPMFILIGTPSLFFIMTSRLTEPNKFRY